MTTRFFTADDGARLAFRDEGAGLPLLCLAGLTRTMADFDYLAPHLPPLRLIRMDARGRGASDWTGAATYTLEREGADAIALLDHLGVTRAAVLGTSRGGMIGMALAATPARGRMLGLCLNDIGPELHRPGLSRIVDYVGRNPAGVQTAAELAERMPRLMPGFTGVPASRWLEETRKHYHETPQGLRITYDPALRDAFVAGFAGGFPDQWAGFDALAGLPVTLIRGANSDLLSPATTEEMHRRRPDMVLAEVPGRAHIPFLDEPAAVSAVLTFVKACQ